MPLNAMGLISVICFLLSLIYIGSSTAYNAIISLSAIAASASYIIPILFFALRKVSGPPIKYGPFKLGRWGIPINLTAIAYLLYIVTWMPFPQFVPITGETFNYAGPVFGTIVLMALGDWFISGRKKFEIPVPRSIPKF
jgi:choline transport protein